jgi:hypothetical protein
LGKVIMPVEKRLQAAAGSASEIKRRIARSDLIRPHSIHYRPAAGLHPVEGAALETVHAAASGKR